MTYCIRGLDPAPFKSLYGLSDTELANLGARRVVADSSPGVPDRIELRDLDVGETAILLNYEHQLADSPYRSRYAIFVREGADTRAQFRDEVPAVMRQRMVALRAFDADGNIVDAELAEGDAIEPAIKRLLGSGAADYLHVHYAKYGCFAARVDRD
ncbi:DUF1203 domain-containing protein [Novosphingopyxis sp. YJ-S2-01]|uniref:DUF1203 domain-containing protein n=1 Tax=Novosphingopyxis sp. YJ-S2-01 TaxID=2794021 RepID=UPI0018DBE4C2|nr:DUF1203 domain-containing protein [Novosphingopyxis sp. YJ-S2-01]MBH9537274.1 DUF1203 domain-containing protein [Novosphingopyxis sp. YJ-S2-01]